MGLPGMRARALMGGSLALPVAVCPFRHPGPRHPGPLTQGRFGRCVNPRAAKSLIRVMSRKAADRAPPHQRQAMFAQVLADRLDACRQPPHIVIGRCKLPTRRSSARY